MKRIMTLFLCVCTIMFCSCSSEDLAETNISENNVITQVEVAELSSVQLQIDSLNQEMFSSATRYQTRGLGNFFKKFLAVVVCDAVGGLMGNFYLGPCGAAAGAIAASGFAAIVPTENISFIGTRAVTNSNLQSSKLLSMNSEELALTPSLVPFQGTSTSGLATKEDSIGYFHNKVLLELNNTLISDDLTANSIVGKIAETTCVNYGESKDRVLEALNSNITFYEDIMNKQYAVSDQFNCLHDVIQKWSVQYPNQSEKLSLLETFFEGISNLEVEENDGEYLNKVLLIIKESSLNEELKQDLRNAFIVGNASYQLWNTEE